VQIFSLEKRLKTADDLDLLRRLVVTLAKYRPTNRSVPNSRVEKKESPRLRQRKEQNSRVEKKGIPRLRQRKV